MHFFCAEFKEEIIMKNRLFSLFMSLIMAISLVGVVPTSLEVYASGGVKAKLDSFISKYPSGTRWTGTFDGGSQCYGFAKLAVYNIFGKYNSSRYRSWYYNGTSTSGMTIVGSVTNYSSSNVKNLLSKAKCGDVLQFDDAKKHSMIVYSVDSSGVTVYDCNWDNNCGISKHYSSFGAWSGRNSRKLTLLRSDNYSKIDGPTPSCNCSTSYAGTYVVSTSSQPLIMRSGHGSNYSVITQIPKGYKVNVLKANGTWAHVRWNGKEGYCAMQYLTKLDTNRKINLHVWISDSKMGGVPNKYYIGEWYYLCYELTYTDTGERIDKSDYSVTETITTPGGKVYSTKYDNSGCNWYALQAYQLGTYTCKVTVSGSVNVDCGVSYTLTEKAHNYGSWTITKSATCTTDGTKIRKCSVCDKTETQTISKTGHNYSTNWTIDKQATCTADGSKSRHCTVCGAKKDVTTIAKTAHKYDNGKITKQPTETATGVRTYTCTVCKTTKTEAIPRLAHKHSYMSKITKQPTCTATGIKTFNCSCGDSYTETIAKTGHSYSTKVIVPTCTSQGYTLHTCSKCGSNYKNNYTDLKEHGYEHFIIEEPTCTDIGEELFICSYCGDSYTETISATGHKYTTTVVKPTYSAQGYTLHKCSTCGNSYKDNYKAKLTLSNITKTNFTSSANAVKMSWNKVSGATGYRVYKYNTSTKKWQTVANTKNTYYTFSKLKSGTTYKFTVRAYRTEGGKTYLSPKYSTFTTSTNPATVNFKLTAGSKKATVKWSKVTGATGYKVYYKTSKNGKWTCLKTANNKTTSYTKTGLKKGKTYYFTVKAYRTVGGKTYNGAFTTKGVKVK